MNPADMVREVFAAPKLKARLIHISGFGRAARRSMPLGIPAGKTYIDPGRRDRKAKQRRERELRRLDGTSDANRARAVARNLELERALRAYRNQRRIVSAVGLGRPVRPPVVA